MTTREVFDRHLRHELDGDLDAILSDYDPTPPGPGGAPPLGAAGGGTTTSARTTSGFFRSSARWS